LFENCLSNQEKRIRNKYIDLYKISFRYFQSFLFDTLSNLSMVISVGLS